MAKKPKSPGGSGNPDPWKKEAEKAEKTKKIYFQHQVADGVKRALGAVQNAIATGAYLKGVKFFGNSAYKQAKEFGKHLQTVAESGRKSFVHAGEGVEEAIAHAMKGALDHVNELRNASDKTSDSMERVLKHGRGGIGGALKSTNMAIASWNPVTLIDQGIGQLLGPIAALMSFGGMLFSMIRTSGEMMPLFKTFGGAEGFTKLQDAIPDMVLSTHMMSGELFKLAGALHGLGVSASNTNQDFNPLLTVLGQGVHYLGITQDAAARLGKTMQMTGGGAPRIKRLFNDMLINMHQTGGSAEELNEDLETGTRLYRRYGSTARTGFETIIANVQKTRGYFKAFNIDVQDVGTSLEAMMGDTRKAIESALWITRIKGGSFSKNFLDVSSGSVESVKSMLSAATGLMAQQMGATAPDLFRNRDQMMKHWGSEGIVSNRIIDMGINKERVLNSMRGAVKPEHLEAVLNALMEQGAKMTEAQKTDIFSAPGGFQKYLDNFGDGLIKAMKRSAPKTPFDKLIEGVNHTAAEVANLPKIIANSLATRLGIKSERDLHDWIAVIADNADRYARQLNAWFEVFREKLHMFWRTLQNYWTGTLEPTLKKVGTFAELGTTIFSFLKQMIQGAEIFFSLMNSTNLDEFIKQVGKTAGIPEPFDLSKMLPKFLGMNAFQYGLLERLLPANLFTDLSDRIIAAMPQGNSGLNPAYATPNGNFVDKDANLRIRPSGMVKPPGAYVPQGVPFDSRVITPHYTRGQVGPLPPPPTLPNPFGLDGPGFVTPTPMPRTGMSSEDVDKKKIALLEEQNRLLREVRDHAKAQNGLISEAEQKRSRERASTNPALENKIRNTVGANPTK